MGQWTSSQMAIHSHALRRWQHFCVIREWHSTTSRITSFLMTSRLRHHYVSMWFSFRSKMSPQDGSCQNLRNCISKLFTGFFPDTVYRLRNMKLMRGFSAWGWAELFLLKFGISKSVSVLARCCSQPPCCSRIAHTMQLRRVCVCACGVQVYTDWANHYLLKAEHTQPITSLQNDLRDGLLLSIIIETISK